MDFTPPSEADVDMAIQDDALLDMNLSAQYAADAQRSAALLGNGLADAFVAGMIPGVAPHPQAQPQQPQLQQPGLSIEEYAALMGVKVEQNPEDLNPNVSNGMGVGMPNGMYQPADPAKVQANAAYFENLYRERIGQQLLGGDMGANPNLTSMTLPAGVGSGINSFMNPGAAPQQAPVYDRTTELAFSQMNARPYDPSTGFSPAPMNVNMNVNMAKPTMHRVGMMQPGNDLGSQTLAPEMLSAMTMMKNGQMHGFEHLSEEEKAALQKEEKSRERNRDHSRKSRQRKKEYVENLKQQVEDLAMFQQICEDSQDVLAVIAVDGKASILYVSPACARVLGYQQQQLASHASFLDLVHPEDLTEVRSIFQKLASPGDYRRFRCRVKAADGEYYSAETSARVGDKGLVCSTRVDRDI